MHNACGAYHSDPVPCCCSCSRAAMSPGPPPVCSQQSSMFQNVTPTFAFPRVTSLQRAVEHTNLLLLQHVCKAPVPDGQQCRLRYRAEHCRLRDGSQGIDAPAPVTGGPDLNICVQAATFRGQPCLEELHIWLAHLHFRDICLGNAHASLQGTIYRGSAAAGFVQCRCFCTSWGSEETFKPPPQLPRA